MAFRATNKVYQSIPSFGFSGAGFLTCYHFGAAKCLLKHGFMNFEPTTSKQSNDVPKPMLTGVSGGAITVAAVAAGVDPEVGMSTTLAVAARTRKEGFFDSLKPG